MYEPIKNPSPMMVRVVQVLEMIQDLIVISLCIGLFSFMVLEVREMFMSLLPPIQFRIITADILFLLILVELFRLLIIYLQEKRVYPEQKVSERYRQHLVKELTEINSKI